MAENRKAIWEKALTDIKKKCGYREDVRCCDNCRWFDVSEETCDRYCANPANEWKAGKPGDLVYFPICGCASVCNKWEGNT